MINNSVSKNSLVLSVVVDSNDRNLPAKKRVKSIPLEIKTASNPAINTQPPVNTIPDFRRIDPVHKDAVNGLLYNDASRGSGQDLIKKRDGSRLLSAFDQVFSVAPENQNDQSTTSRKRHRSPLLVGGQPKKLALESLTDNIVPLENFEKIISNSKKERKVIKLSNSNIARLIFNLQGKDVGRNQPETVDGTSLNHEEWEELWAIRRDVSNSIACKKCRKKKKDISLKLKAFTEKKPGHATAQTALTGSAPVPAKPCETVSGRSESPGLSSMY
ncbi:MAG: hypothetical protein ACPG5T_06965 [Endozoicomonas sp.]